jgi:hypothetical protein
MRRQLRSWLELSLDQQLPPAVLLYSRALCISLDAAAGAAGSAGAGAAGTSGLDQLNQVQQAACSSSSSMQHPSEESAWQGPAAA